MSFEKLGWYVEDRMPELYNKIASFSKDEVRQVMNAATGIAVQSSEPVARSCEYFIAELREMEQNGTLYLVALPAAMKEAIRIEVQRSIG